MYERLRREAFAERTSIARLIRARLEQSTPNRRTRSRDPLSKIEGIVQNGRLTEGIDEAIYSS